jgi:hypothetical protein
VDRGRWRHAGRQANAIHPAIVQRDDGTILSYLHASQPDAGGGDEGPGRDVGDSGDAVSRHWRRTEDCAAKLASGALLVCSADAGRKLVSGGTFAALSLDDGKTWPHVRKIDAPVGATCLSPRGRTA